MVPGGAVGIRTVTLYRYRGGADVYAGAGDGAGQGGDRIRVGEKGSVAEKSGIGGGLTDETSNV